MNNKKRISLKREKINNISLNLVNFIYVVNNIN